MIYLNIGFGLLIALCLGVHAALQVRDNRKNREEQARIKAEKLAILRDFEAKVIPMIEKVKTIGDDFRECARHKGGDE